MKGDSSSRRHDKPAMVIAVIALVIALGGTAFAAVATNSKSHKLPPNSVGSRQIKAQAVTTAKFAEGAVEGAKVSHSLTGADFNTAEFGRAPTATEAQHAAAASKLIDPSTPEPNPAACPTATRLIHGICFDTVPSGPVTGVKAAADGCAEKGGYLPTTEELASTRATLELGSGADPHNMFTDSYFADPEHKEAYGTMVVSEAGTKIVLAQEYVKKSEPAATEEYLCVYPLIR